MRRLGDVGYVDGPVHGATAERADLRGGRVGFGVVIEVAEGDIRALLREHTVSSELWAKMIEAFGRQRTVECMELMGDYFIVGTMMNAADQHLPPTRQPLLPALKR